MVFKTGTFHGEKPEHFDGPHPAWLESAVAENLAAAGDVDASDITVTCRGTRVILTGNVASEEEAQRAVAVAGATKGVESVENRLSSI
ncbi:BON domain-containing protein [Sinorhizobium sp. BG8]|uniref:BON domain-containing protein n=1 Tax=Sinorhizobium sp. BG8 TaxID=2613773 RepID=UPI00193E752C|nr:BON domain-containing protein [Sinorhizobium sp. BG8]QRM53401.1 BON domain-containing protein [Sinorhizobium sp. BG8]